MFLWKTILLPVYFLFSPNFFVNLKAGFLLVPSTGQQPASPLPVILFAVCGCVVVIAAVLLVVLGVYLLKGGPARQNPDEDYTAFQGGEEQ